MAKPVLLSVDDDPDVLRAIERDLRSQYGAEYRVIGSDSPEAALDLIKIWRYVTTNASLEMADRVESAIREKIVYRRESRRRPLAHGFDG